jgi:hypothetical protein
MTARLFGFTSALAIAAALPAAAEMSFNRIATFPVTANMAPGEDMARESSAEIISASEDGMTLVYSDSPLGVVGMIDIADPRGGGAAGRASAPRDPLRLRGDRHAGRQALACGAAGVA